MIGDSEEQEKQDHEMRRRWCEAKGISLHDSRGDAWVDHILERLAAIIEERGNGAAPLYPLLRDKDASSHGG